MRPIFIPDLARARRADWAPGPGVLVLCEREQKYLVDKSPGKHWEAPQINTKTYYNVTFQNDL